MVNIFAHSFPERVYLVSPNTWLCKMGKRIKNIKIKDLYQEDLDSSTLKGWFNSLVICYIRFYYFMYIDAAA